MSICKVSLVTVTKRTL